MNIGKYLTEKIETNKEELKEHFIDCTAMITASQPFYVALEKIIGACNEDYIIPLNKSLQARFWTAAVAYGGMAWVYSKGRKLSRKVFHITEKSKERIQGVHDGLYTMAFSGLTIGLVYLLSQETDTDKLALISGITAASAIPRGFVIGYFIDTFKDLFNFKKCERPSYPQRIRNLSPRAKKGVLAATIAASLTLIGGMYYLGERFETQNLEQTIQNDINN